MSTLAHWKSEHELITNTLLKALVKYVKTYPHFLIGAIAPSNVDQHSLKTKALTIDDIAIMNDQMLSAIIQGVFCFDAINLQKYQKGIRNFNH